MTHSHTKPLNSIYRDIRILNDALLNRYTTLQTYKQKKEAILAQVEVSHWPVVQNKFVV